MAALLGRNDILIEQHETFPKQTYRNRCVIYTANGAQNLSVPVIKPYGNRTKTKDILIQYTSSHWQTIHLRALESAYRKAPYFDHYIGEIDIFFKKPHALLIDLNQSILRGLLSLLRLKLDVGLTTCFEKNPGDQNDLRNRFSPKKRPDSSIFPVYYQVFNDRFGFIPNLSILDLLFCGGPEAINYLVQLSKTIQDRQS
jgi:hypothetical protein